jgi:hypothetical protein
MIATTLTRAKRAAQAKNQLLSRVCCKNEMNGGVVWIVLVRMRHGMGDPRQNKAAAAYMIA